MRNLLSMRAYIAISAAVLLLSSCAGTPDTGWVVITPEPRESGPIIHIVGTVHHLDLEGGVFVIRTADGTQYSPTNLPEAFRVEGMGVEAEGWPRDDMASIGMVGRLVELSRIRGLHRGDKE